MADPRVERVVTEAGPNCTTVTIHMTDGDESWFAERPLPDKVPDEFRRVLGEWWAGPEAQEYEVNRWKDRAAIAESRLKELRRIVAETAGQYSKEAGRSAGME